MRGEGEHNACGGSLECPLCNEPEKVGIGFSSAKKGAVLISSSNKSCTVASKKKR